ncbi:MAG TPA: hypothetical protein VEX38_00990, partial [Fimbriimonadaceae bacterium]|nr:hypothetical protein [Fimbriimonadaceae bacterium]
MTATIFAAFEDAAHAEKAAGALLDHGLAPEDISLVRSDREAKLDGNVKETYVGYEDSEHHEVLGTSYGSAVVTDSARPPLMHEDPLHTPSQQAYGAQMAGGITSGDPLSYHPEGEAPFDDAGPAPTYDRNDPYVIESDVQAEVAGDSAAKTERAAKTGISTTTAADAGAGAVKGAAVGLGVGVLAALASVFIPG